MNNNIKKDNYNNFNNLYLIYKILYQLNHIV